MKTSHLLSTVAATLLLSTGVTLAQSPQTPERAPSAQQQAPAEKMGPSINAGEKKAPETTGQASPDSKSGASPSPSMKAGEKAGDAKPSATTGQSPSGSDPKAKGATDANKAASGQSDSKPGASTQSEPGANRSAAPGASPSASSPSGTTGQGAAAGSAKLSTEQRSKITTVIKQQKVQAVQPSQLNVSISVGTKVPNTVHLYPLPAEVITVYPEWRGYSYILVGEQIIIIHPRSHEIVYIISV